MGQSSQRPQQHHKTTQKERPTKKNPNDDKQRPSCTRSNNSMYRRCNDNQGKGCFQGRRRERTGGCCSDDVAVPKLFFHTALVDLLEYPQPPTHDENGTDELARRNGKRCLDVSRSIDQLSCRRQQEKKHYEISQPHLLANNLIAFSIPLCFSRTSATVAVSGAKLGKVRCGQTGRTTDDRVSSFLRV